MKKNVVKKFFSASILVLGVSVIARFFGLIKEMVVASSFGLSAELDTFYLSLMIPALVISTLTNPLASAFVPRYDQLKNKSERASMDFMNSVSSSMIALLFITSSVYFLVRPVLFEVIFSLIFSTFIIIQGLSNYYLAILENLKLFLFTSFGAIFSSLFVIVFVLIDKSILYLALGFVLGPAFYLLVQFVVLKKRLSLGLLWVMPFKNLDLSFKQQYGVLFLGSFLMGSTFLIDQTMASYVGSESVSALNYGFRVVALFTGTATLALGSVALPFFSNLHIEGRITEMKELLRKVLWLVFGSSFIIVFLVWVFGQDLVSLLFERGNFSATDSEKVTEIFQFYIFQLPFYVGGIVLVRIISVVQKNKAILLISGVNFILNIGLNFILLQYWGLKGIALSTSIVYFISFLLLWRNVRLILSTD
jgi:putative peptidoglycan lipid II flippase